jgi:hypothetical protein
MGVGFGVGVDTAVGAEGQHLGHGMQMFVAGHAAQVSARQGVEGGVEYSTGRNPHVRDFGEDASRSVCSGHGKSHTFLLHFHRFCRQRGANYP